MSPKVCPIFTIGGQPVHTISAVMTSDTAVEVTTSQLRIELMFPADGAAEAFFHHLVRRGALSLDLPQAHPGGCRARQRVVSDRPWAKNSATAAASGRSSTGQAASNGAFQKSPGRGVQGPT